MNSINSINEALCRSDSRFAEMRKDKQCVDFTAGCFYYLLDIPFSFSSPRMMKDRDGYGNAINWYDQWAYEKGKTAKVGAIGVFDSTHGSGYGHVFIVKDVNTGLIAECNYSGQFYHERKINLNASDIIGYCYIPNWSEPTPTPTKSIEEVAKEVINGKWGNGVDRKNRLEASGYNYDEVQNKVNELLHSDTLSIGDEVIINGSLYVSSNATSPSGSVHNRKTKITRYVEGAKHPYNTTGDLGWCDKSSLTKC